EILAGRVRRPENCRSRCTAGLASSRPRCPVRRRVTQAPPDRLDRRLTPRPLPAHLASAMLLWLSSRAALTSLSFASPHSNAADEPLRALAPEVERLGADQVGAALDRELLRRASGFAAGLEAYRQPPVRR